MVSRVQDMRKVLARNRELQFDLDDMREDAAALRAELAAVQVCIVNTLSAFIKTCRARSVLDPVTLLSRGAGGRIG